jgi:hypothetical protein
VSSSDARQAFQVDSSGFTGLQSAEDLVAEPSTQDSDRLRLGVAGSLAFGDVSLPETRTTESVAVRFARFIQVGLSHGH